MLSLIIRSAEMKCSLETNDAVITPDDDLL